ncbi:MAG TPA: diguanylate cyclase [Candidatus Nanopelagicales bacterium]|nr:diguanylate cyclase [Candidatus Nanopelagicales bacterium]
MAGTGSGLVASMLHVSHPDHATRRRARNALVVIYAIVVISLPATVALFFIPDGRTVGTVAVLATLLIASSALLLRRGRVSLGLSLFFFVFIGSFLASVLFTHDSRLVAIYFTMPVGIAGVTVKRYGLVIITIACVALGIWATLAFPVSSMITGFEVIVASLLLVAMALTASVLGLEGQRAETSRADEYAARLQRSNDELEHRVAERTEQLQHALDRQEQLVSELAELSLRDPLTGLHNRRHADAELPRLASAADRHEQPLSMAMADLDHFKRVNDDHSYLIGDEVLRQFAAILRRATRSSDVVTRYGGEEFLVLMPQTTLEQAVVLCERVRAEVEAHDWAAIDEGVHVTVSIGVSDSLTSGGLVTIGADADAALHRAKREGRNRVVAAHRESPAQGR